jgi:hypothetical protein
VAADAVFEDWFALDETRAVRDSGKWVASFVDTIYAVGALGDPKPNLFLVFTLEDSFKKLQKVLSTPIRSKHLTHMKNDWVTRFHQLRYADCVGHGEDASAWLEAFPRNASLTLLDADFRMSCIFRLGLKVPEIVQAAMEKGGRFHHKCPSCSTKGLDKADIDDYGHHMAHGCSFRGGHQNTHNAVVSVLAAMYKSEGFSVTKEVTLAPLIPNSVVNGVDNGAKNLRVDLIVRDTIMKVVEVTITDPCLSVAENMPSIVSRARQIEETREAEKIRKYKSDKVIIDGDNARSLQVFALGVFVRFNDSAYKYMRELSRSKGRTGYESVFFRQLWFQRISCALQRMLSCYYKENLCIFRGEMRFDRSSVVSARDYYYVDASYVNATGKGN